MYYKIQKCNEIKSDHELLNNFKYDAVIRFRADIKLEESLNINSNLNNIYIPKYGDFLGVNDQFAYSNSQNMDTYCNLYQNINEYTKDIIVFNPEYFLKHHIMTNGFKIKRFPLEYKLACHGQLLDNQIREREWLSTRI